MGLPLPSELVGSTFNYLDIPSLLRCMRVCKLFHSIISESTLLCYKIELFASYMEDNELSPINLVTRLNLLREYNRVWNYMDFPSSGLISMHDISCWEFAGGVLAQATHDNEIFFVQLPSKLKGIAETRWSAPFDFAIRDFTFDNSQDLVVLVELVGNFPDVLCNVHLRTLSGKHHPRADMPQITHDPEDLCTEFTLVMQICGDHIAILFYDPSNPPTQNSFVVWNWRTGRREVYFCTPNIRSFAFMTENLILVGIVKEDTEPALRVLSMATCIDPILSLEDMPYICELQYPECSASTDHFLIRSEPTPSWRPPPGSGVPFYYSRKDFIFIISVRHSLEWLEESTILFVPLSTLLSEVELSSTRRNVAWRNWGPRGARMIKGDLDDIWVCYTYGMKFVLGLPREGRQVVRIYDFNPHAVRKYVKSTIDSHLSWKPLAAASRPIARSEIFDEDVVTTLPGRVTSFRLGDSHGAGRAGWEAVMIGEDHILMVQAASSQYGYMAT